MNRFKELVHYIISECESANTLGAVKLNKILLFADTHEYLETGRSLTETQYVKRRFGPVPELIYNALQELSDEKKISIVEPNGRYSSRAFHALTAPSLSSLTDEQKVRVKAITDLVCAEFTAREISEITHDDLWRAAAEGEVIPLQAQLVGEAGDYNQVVRDWANQTHESLRLN